VEAYELRRGRYKNLTLRLIPPEGTLRVSAPWYLPKLVIDGFVAERASWIAKKRQALAAAPAADTVGTWVWGVRHRLRVESPGRLPRVVVADGEAVLRVPASWTPAQRQGALDRWEAARVEEALAELIPRWSAATGLRVAGWTVKRLRSRWGSCQPDAATLVFNARLGAFPPECLEHVVVHELAHLVEARHNKRFHALVESWLPGADRVRKLLRAGPGGPASAGGPGAVPDPHATPGEGRPPSAPAQ
jgi:hypothetical protein